MAAPNVRAAVAGVAAALSAAALAAPLVVDFEGWRNVPYPDPALGSQLMTVCAGATSGVQDRVYTDHQCAELLARDLAVHAQAIAPCLPADLPVETRAAFVSAAYNLGPRAFCNSSMSRKAQGGDLLGACDALRLWVNAGGRPMPGLVRRRAVERSLCLSGIADREEF